MMWHNNIIITDYTDASSTNEEAYDWGAALVKSSTYALIWIQLTEKYPWPILSSEIWMNS